MRIRLRTRTTDGPTARTNTGTIDHTIAERAADEIIVTASRRPLTIAEAVAADVLLGVAEGRMAGGER